MITATPLTITWCFGITGYLIQFFSCDISVQFCHSGKDNTFWGTFNVTTSARSIQVLSTATILMWPFPSRRYPYVDIQIQTNNGRML